VCVCLAVHLYKLSAEAVSERLDPVSRKELSVLFLGVCVCSTVSPSCNVRIGRPAHWIPLRAISTSAPASPTRLHFSGIHLISYILTVVIGPGHLIL